MTEKFLKPSPKKFADKARSPEETIRWVTERFEEAGADIFQELRRVDKGRLGIPVYISLYGAEGLSVTGNVKQMGKGATEPLAQASALMELAERYSLFRYIRNQANFLLAPLQEHEDAISAEDLLSSVEDPSEDQEASNLCRRILPEIPFHLAPAFEVHRKRRRLLPIYWFWLLYEYNGSSAGNTYAEAAVQGTCELIERHASALASLQKTPFREVVLDGVSPETEALLSCFQRLGIKLFLRDFTFGMPVATIGALAYDPSTFPHRSEIVYTAGTATSPERALVRALTEVAQLAGDFDTDGKYLESGLPKYATLEEAAHLLEKDGEVSLRELPDLSAPDHAEELQRLALALAEKGFTLYLLDATSPELRVPVVYNVIPGVHFRERIKIPPLYQLVRTVALYLPAELALSILEPLSKEISRYYVESARGQVLSKLERWKEAASCFEKALTLSPYPEDLPAIYCHLAHALLQAGDFHAAREVVEKALGLSPMPELYNLLGTINFKEGRTEAALEAYFQAVALDPQRALDYANIGACLLALGLPQEAETYFTNAKMLDPALDLERFRQVRKEGSHV
ncbi:MAG: tetratricopeptide repeat protein [Thermodesulfobacteria bacterium]|nr:tetratricopeptide repeat protein [Thermodesulfobacteriota bacterium]